MKDSFTVMTFLLYLSQLTGAIDDYWAEDFDKDKNCVRESEMKELKMGGRCTSVGFSGEKKNIVHPYCPPYLS